MIFRLANSLDALELKKLNDFFNGEGCNTVEAIEESLRQNEQEVICVAEKGSMLVGFCCGQIMKSMCYSSKYGEITELFVMEEYRHQGIGRELLRIIENELDKYGVKHLHILTGNDNIAAQMLYISCGYSKAAEILLDKN